MHLVSFEKAGRATLGVRQDDSVVDLSVAAPDLPDTWPEVFERFLLSAVEKAAADAAVGAILAAGDLTLLPPIPRPPKIICVGLNYKAHAAEVGMELPDYPTFFARWPGSLVGDGAPLVKPAVSDQFDYEIELAVIVGKGGRHIPEDKALEHVAGYSIINEGSVRDFQFKGAQWTMGKNFEKSGSFGPAIVTADELPPGADGLRVTTQLNDQTVQDSNTNDMIFPIASIIAHASAVFSLEPGDVISTGTPEGVGMGRKPPLWMKPGDRCTLEIESIGRLSNPVVEEGA